MVLSALSLGLILFVSLVPTDVSAADPALTTESQTQDDKDTESEEEKPEGKLRRLESLIRGPTPEERARLEEERRRLSEAASLFGTDPTAIIGYYQLTYGHSEFTHGLRLDTATAVIRLPVTPNFGVQVTMPYVWADQHQRQGFPTNGTSDLVLRVGGRVYTSEYVAVFLGTDVLFPTASEKQLGTGSYVLGPGVVLASPLARLRSMFYLVVQDYNSVTDDPARPDVHFMQVQGTFNTIWSEHWWTSVGGTWNSDWNVHRKTASYVQAQVGYRFGHWNVFAGPGVGITGDNTPLGVDWTVQAGVRWVFKTPLIPERLFKGLPKGGS
jgi:hypothetical protein